MILLAGATGLVGGLTLDRLLARDLIVTTIGRRPTGRRHGGLHEVVADLTRAAPSLAGPFDAAVCALGTTMRKAGSRAAFRAVDFDAVVNFARCARDAGATCFVLISAVGANPDSSNFYLRVKGEAETAISHLGFTRVDILRPGLLLGKRAERRPAEALGIRLAPMLNLLMRGPLSRYAGIPATTVASAAATCAADLVSMGVRVLENDAMRASARL